MEGEAEVEDREEYEDEKRTRGKPDERGLRELKRVKERN